MYMKNIHIGINGCGRVAKNLIRIIDNIPHMKMIAVNHYNKRISIEDVVHYVQYDSVHGSYTLKNTRFTVYNYSTPSEIPWDEIIDIIIDTTGKFKCESTLYSHIKHPHQRVILTCPSKHLNEFVYGANHTHIQPNEKVISAASCTTNAVTPVLKIIHELLSIETLFVTTIHSLTASNCIVDKIVPLEESCIGCSSLLNIIPAPTGSNTSICKILPVLIGKIHASAFRVPLANISVASVVIQIKTPTTIERIINIIQTYSPILTEIVEISELSFGSSAYIGNKHSGIIDKNNCIMIDETHIKLTIWYDNEVGYCWNVLNLINVWKTI